MMYITPELLLNFYCVLQEMYIYILWHLAFTPSQSDFIHFFSFWPVDGYNSLIVQQLGG